MSDEELAYLDSIIGPPTVKPVRVEKHFDYAIVARGTNYPWDENIDYDPSMDEDQEDLDNDRNL